MRGHRSDNWDTRFFVVILYLFLLLPRHSIQELSQLPASPNGHAQPQPDQGAPRPESLTMSNSNFNQAANAQSSVFRRLGLLPLASSGNMTLKELADDIGRLEGNLASLIQSFLALQRSVFNLEQLQELLVLLLEDILKQTGNVDKSAKDRATGSASSTSSDDNRSGRTDDGMDSAEIDETGEGAGDGNNGDAQGKDGDGAEDKLDDRSARGGSAAGGGNDNKNQGGTDPYNNMLHSGTPNNHQRMGTPVAENQRQIGPTTHSRISHDSDGGSSEGMNSESDEEEGGASMANANSVLTKGISSNKAASTNPKHPQLSEPLVSMTSQLEARLSDMIRRLNPSATRHRPQRLANIRTMPGEQQHLPHLTGESPLAPRPLFEPVEVLISGSDGNSACADGKVAVQSQGVKVKQRMPVVSHGGPLVGPEDFSSPFMERLDVLSSNGESLNEQSTGMISNMMHKANVPKAPIEISEDDAHLLQTTSSTTGAADQENLTTPTTTMATSQQDFDQMIAALLQDLSEHLEKQRANHEEQSKTNDVIDQAVVELSKLTWIQKPTEKDSSARPEYMVHMAAANVPPSKQDDDLIVDYKNPLTTVLYQSEEPVQRLDGKNTPADSQGVVADRMLSTHLPHVPDSNLPPVQTPGVQDEVVAKDKTHSLLEAHTASTVNPTYSAQNPSTRQWDGENNAPAIWEWLKYYKQGNADFDTSLALLIELLSELSSEEHNTSKELEVFSDRGQKITKGKIQSENSATENWRKSENTDISSNVETLDADVSNDDEDKTTGKSESIADVSSEDKDFKHMQDHIKGKRLSDHPNSLFSHDSYTHENNNNIVASNESDSSSSENQGDDISSDSDSVESDDDDIHLRDNPKEKRQDGNVKNEENLNNAPLNLDLTKTKERGKVRTDYTKSGNEVSNTQYIQIPPIKDSEFEMYHGEGHMKNTMNQIYGGRQEGQSDSEDSETSDSEDGDNAYMGTNRIGQETHLFSPLVRGSQSGETSPGNMHALLVNKNHLITKRNIKKPHNLDTMPLKSTRKMFKPKYNRKKRQAEAFWQQFLDYGLNPAAQQGMPSNLQGQSNLQNHGTLQRHDNVPSHGNLQSAGNRQSHGILQGQGGLPSLGHLQGHNGILSHEGLQAQGLFHDLGQNPNQNVFHHSQNKPSQIGQTHGQGPLQNPILPFRGYPQYSRYNYFGGYNYPHFGYPDHPGMNHEPGESPSFEAGPSADVMEEVLNSLFQRYWENVRNMLAVKGPSTTPENEYEGPITTTTASPTTTTTTVAATTTTTTTIKPAVMTTSTSKPSMKTVFPNGDRLATTQSPPIDIANTTTVNATTAVNSTKNQAPEAQIPAVQGSSLDISTPLDPLAQVFQNIGTDKNTALPPNFFQRKTLPKTSPFPFF